MLHYSVTIFLSAYLLFQVQPMIAKIILPWFGGAAAVWITAMLFFQTTLLGGYLYAHWSIRALRPKMQATVHVLLLAASLAFLPVMPAISWKPSGNEDPIVRILALLAVSVGLPYALLSTTSPLLQAWYSRKSRTSLPYRLFALSNVASLMGLLAYPLLIEPAMTLRQQSLVWSCAYAVFAVLAAVAAVVARREPLPATGEGNEEQEVAGDSPRPPVRELLLWLSLSACASMLLLSVTNHLTQNITSIPFLWVLPLSLYLLTFILVFDHERIYNPKVFSWLMLLALGGMACGLLLWNASIKLLVPLFCCGLFITCMFLHGELVRRKPAPKHLTLFYLMLSAGGSLGGLLVGLVAPNVLPGVFELPFALIACAALLLAVGELRAWNFITIASWVAAAVVLVTSGYYITAYSDSSRVMLRNFYGGLRVLENNKGTFNETRSLAHGTVYHGLQFMAPGRRREVIYYYRPGSGIDLAWRSRRHSPLRVGVIGLGAGSLAAFAERGDVVRFYEIDPQVIMLARTEFTFLADCKGTVETVLGDGRLSLEREPDQQFDILVVDAFSGDAIPVHLLTKQAMELYFRHLRPNGILAFHLTNVYLDLVPVVEAVSRDFAKEAVFIKQFPSIWALVSSQTITVPDIAKAAWKPAIRPGFRVWTDDYNNLFQALK